MHGRVRFVGNLLSIITPLGTLVGSGLAQDCPVRTTLHMIDKHRQPVVNLTADQLKAEIKGSLANVSSLSPEKPRIILMLDVSRSMKSAWNQSIEAARHLVERAGENVVTIIFGDAIYGKAIGRSESQDLLDQFAKKVPFGGTALYDSLIQIASHLTIRNAAIVVISDGEDDASLQSSAATVSQFLRSSWPPVFGIILDYDHSSHRVREYFKKVSDATGGFVIYPSSASQVRSAADELAAIALNSFTLTLQPTQPMEARAKLRLTVIGPQGKPDKDITLLHVAEIPGCNSHEQVREQLGTPPR